QTSHIIISNVDSSIPCHVTPSETSEPSLDLRSTFSIPKVVRTMAGRNGLVNFLWRNISSVNAANIINDRVADLKLSKGHTKAKCWGVGPGECTICTQGQRETQEYREHGGARKEDSLRKDDITASSPSLSSTSTSTSRDGLLGDAGSSKGWDSPSSSQLSHGRTSASSWTSTPDLQSLSSDTTSRESATARLSKWTSSSSSTSSPSSTISSSSSQTHSAAKPPIPPSSVSTSTSSSSGADSELRRRFNERRKSTELAQGTSTTSGSSSSVSRNSSSESSTPLRSRRLLVQEVKTIENSSVDTKKDGVNPDVEFII
ncbi:hypothetical protein J437_LFUL001372, partial [Ladona fulva]